MTVLPALSGYQRLGLVTIFGLLTLVVLGGAVRVTDSGLACPDWPLCNGKLIAEGDYHVWLEWTHRLAASLIGFIIIAFVAGAVLRYRDRPWIVGPALIGAIVLAVQVVLGGLTVTEDLAAAVVSAHLGTAMIIILLMLVAWLATFVPQQGRSRDVAAIAIRRTPPTRSDRRMAALVILTALSAFGLIVLGGYVSGTEAGFFCDGGWPLCNGSLLPEGRNAGIQVAHRYLAAFVGLLILATGVIAFRRSRRAPAALYLAGATVLLLALQVVLGGVLMWTALESWARVLHLVTGTITWGLLVCLTALAVYGAVRFPSLHRRTPLPLAKPFPFRQGAPQR